MKKQTPACPCGGASYENCCGLYLSGSAQAPTAEALMRSRYTAYVHQDASYLMRSWHPNKRPPRVDFDPKIKWVGLKVIDVVAGSETDADGTVKFIARYKTNGKAEKLQERSQFERLDGAWVYVDEITE